MAGLLRKHVRAKPMRILEIGAGDGTFMLAVARRLAKNWPAVELTLLDRIDLVSPGTRDGFGKLGWRVETVTADVFEWIAQRRARALRRVIANLFLHHFDNADLARLFSGPATAGAGAAGHRAAPRQLSAGRGAPAVGDRRQ